MSDSEKIRRLAELLMDVCCYLSALRTNDDAEALMGIMEEAEKIASDQPNGDK